MITVVIPTYNEADNVGVLAERLFALDLPDLNLLFVDDTSPDGTSDVVRQLAGGNDRIRLISRLGKGGRGGACIAAFQQIMEEGFRDGDIVVEMDADLSHDPADLPRLIGKLDDHGMVVGSRWVAGGEVRNWPWGRWVLSRLANHWARWVLGIPMSDYTTGFRAYRGELLREIDWAAVQARGYIVLTEMAWQIHRAGHSIGEVPIVFVNRVRGESNLSIDEVISAFTSVLRLRRSRR